jgi:hypothetical protein
VLSVVLLRVAGRRAPPGRVIERQMKLAQIDVGNLRSVGSGAFNGNLQQHFVERTRPDTSGKCKDFHGSKY